MTVTTTAMLPAAVSNEHQLQQAATEHRFQQFFAASRRHVDIAAAAFSLLLALPMLQVRFLSMYLNLASPSSAALGNATASWTVGSAASSSHATAAAAAAAGPPWLSTFPSSASKALQLAWWWQHWRPALGQLPWNWGGWECTVWAPAGAVAVLLLPATQLGGENYYRCRAVLLAVWRLVPLVLSLATLAANKWVTPGALPMAGLSVDRSTLWGATTILWSSQLHALPLKLQLKLVAPLELLLTVACALVPRTPPAPQPPLPQALLCITLASLLAACLSIYIDRLTRRHFLRATDLRPASPAKSEASSGAAAATYDTSTLHPGEPASCTAALSGSRSSAVAQAAPEASITSAAAASSLPCPGGKLSQSTLSGGTAGKPAGTPLYRSATKTHIISIKVYKPPTTLLADSRTLQQAVTSALLPTVPPAGVGIRRIHCAVFQGCIQLVAWVQVESPDDAGIEHGSIHVLLADLQAAAEEAARAVIDSTAGGDEPVRKVVSSCCMQGGAMALGAEEPDGWLWLEGGPALVAGGPAVLAGAAAQVWEGENASMDGPLGAVLVHATGEGLVRRLLGLGQVRAVVVEGAGGRVLLDAEVAVEDGCWPVGSAAAELVATSHAGSGAASDSGHPCVLSLRLPQIHLPAANTTAHSGIDTRMASAHLLLLPVGDQQGEVLWSTPLLLDASPAVAAELRQLHTAMAADLLPQHGATAAADVVEVAIGHAYEQHLVPLVQDLLHCRQLLEFPDAAQLPAERARILHVVSFLEAAEPSMEATLAWLLVPSLETSEAATAPVTAMTEWDASAQASAAAGSSSGTELEPQGNLPAPYERTSASSPPPGSSLPTPPLTIGPNASPAPSGSSSCHVPHVQPTMSTTVIRAVLRGKFSSPADETSYKQFLAHRTTLPDRTFAVVMVLPLAGLVFKCKETVDRCLYLIHFLAAAALQLCLCTSMRYQHRQQLVVSSLCLPNLHVLLHNLGWLEDPSTVRIWRTSPLVGVLSTAFHVAGHQAGFTTTTTMTSVLALQMAGFLTRHIPLAALAPWMVLLTALTAAVAFVGDAMHRLQFLRTRGSKAVALSGTASYLSHKKQC